MIARAHPRPGSPRQRGATLIICLIVLALITIVVVNAFNLSSSNLKAVSNMQMRDEATAAANQAIEQVVSSPFYNSGAQTVNVDINKDGTSDFQVVVAAPTCLRAWVSSSADASDVELGAAMTAVSQWYTDWDLDATATDLVAGSGVSVRVRQGIRAVVDESVKNSYCP